MLDGLGALVGGQVRLWRFDGRALRLAAGPDPGEAPTVPRSVGLTPVPWGTVWLEPLGEVDGFWLEVGGLAETALETAAARTLPLVGALLDAERQRAFLADELTSRYEEIDLLYAISEILGQTVQLEEATRIIAREVSTVVGARRASIMVFDEPAGVLRTVAARGFDMDGLTPVPVDDECSVAARVYRERRVVANDPSAPDVVATDCGEPRGYHGQAFLSVPICYGAAGSPLRCDRARPLRGSARVVRSRHIGSTAKASGLGLEEDLTLAVAHELHRRPAPRLGADDDRHAPARHQPLAAPRARLRRDRAGRCAGPSPRRA